MAVRVRFGCVGLRRDHAARLAPVNDRFHPPHRPPLATKSTIRNPLPLRSANSRRAHCLPSTRPFSGLAPSPLFSPRHFPRPPVRLTAPAARLRDAPHCLLGRTAFHALSRPRLPLRRQRPEYTRRERATLPRSTRLRALSAARRMLSVGWS
ncbi:uncharacterized protein K452DRAFT_304231 [Aplosporella prunicola CBS 121167]|uniref:Uncharacterized protein n=1 Tax=Aplosporella prunicola CBS 121167 TaxID=1176127 RepID=A0A6A6BTC7_9PEZI|nr:uncharacterized protein K452DRAFT_304231 [Aplosporella prunicola CBS 121167]KAF2147379.1 hypothetical protein K452DRAFT_304231 [Aplosporella prunicola CBS 121167]